MSTAYIYALTEPDGTIRYIGRSTNPQRRLRGHMRSKALPEVHAWLRALLDSGQRPGLLILETIENDISASFKEMAHVGAHRGLLNIRGNGRPGHCRFCGSTEHMGPRCRAPESPFRNEPLGPIRGHHG